MPFMEWYDHIRKKMIFGFLKIPIERKRINPIRYYYLKDNDMR